MSLKQSVEAALANSQNIKQSEAGVEQAQGALAQAKGKRGLNLNWSWSYNQLSGNTYDRQNLDHMYSNQLTAQLPLYTGGSLENAVKAAKEGLDVSGLTLENTKQLVKLQATQDYYQILECINTIRVRKNAVTQLAEHERVANAKYAAGVVPKTDVLRSQVQLADAKQYLVYAENNLAIAESNFNKLIGQDLRTSVTPLDDYLGVTNYRLTLQECVARALENRPDYLAAQKSVAQAQAGVAAAKGANYPQVALVAQKATAGDSSFGDNMSDKANVGVQANWNIFDNGVTSAQVKQQQAVLKQAEANRDNVRDQVQLDVRQAYLTMLAAEKNIQTTKVAVKQAAEDDRIAKISYEAGVSTNTDRLDANVAYVTAQMNYNKALYEYTISRAALDRAMGVPSNIYTIENGVQANRI